MTPKVLVGFIAVIFSSLAFADPAGRSTVKVHDFDTLAEIPGAVSSLRRTDHGVSMTLRTNSLPQGAYTNWWIVFNDPDKCTDPIPEINALCGEKDLGVEEVDPSVLFATGNVVGPNGQAGFAAHLSEGDFAGALFGPGLIDARVAEIHIVVRHHGEVIPMHMPAQIHTFNGGCPPNDCVDLQAAAHSP